jgi:hypothetical protein
MCLFAKQSATYKGLTALSTASNPPVTPSPKPRGEVRQNAAGLFRRIKRGRAPALRPSIRDKHSTPIGRSRRRGGRIEFRRNWRGVDGSKSAINAPASVLPFISREPRNDEAHLLLDRGNVLAGVLNRLNSFAMRAVEDYFRTARSGICRRPRITHYLQEGIKRLL